MPSFAPDDNTAEMAPVQSPSPVQPPEPFPEVNRHQTSDPGSRSTTADNQPGESQKPKTTSRDFMENNCRYSDDYHPPGWARLAAMPDYINNADVFRTFSYSGVRLIQYTGARLAFLNTKLDDFDRGENMHLRGLTKYQTRVPGRPESKDEYDLLVEAYLEEYLQYSKKTRQMTSRPAYFFLELTLPHETSAVGVQIQANAPTSSRSTAALRRHAGPYPSG
ncbi:hypothetical protein B0T25DRAFT_94126 [Lasiosphaeria hispida]|uniref:Uncharacterized protein n=1 Tax=Lasiosphaeria hispida TaxID=260671 RepID=A0AAJ0HQD0_9PEZI|nr:hypothetical protein B0T25DRAFT_94126 [Lasiosphaeria hispida]